VKEITLSDNTSVLVDDDDYERLSQWKWSANGNGYAVRNERYEPKKYRKQYLHRAIMNAKPGEIVDHINGNTLDNRKDNLRICDLRGNAQNSRGKKRMYSQYKGVSFDKRRQKWVAQISVDTKNVSLGGFTVELDAALAYNKAATEHYGEFAQINII
jgi:hypothetical protein